MLSLNLPTYNVKISQKDGKKYIFDELRRKFVNLSPEEWVRQHFVHFLVEHKGYPKNLMGNEICLKVNGMSRRCDTVLYHRNLMPQMIIEYKAPEIAVNQKVFSQISTYNMVLKVDYLIVSNGIDHYICKMDYTNQSYTFLKDIPNYNELISL